MKRKIAIFIAIIITSFMINPSYAQSTLNVKAFIDSYYNFYQGKMRPVLDPVHKPFLCDTITIELHMASTYRLAFSEKTIFDIYGNGSVTIPENLTGHSYYLVLKHRNSLETCSSNPIFISRTVIYDFTTSTDKAFGNNQIWVEKAACLYSGDINQDGKINAADFKLFDSDNTRFVFGFYNASDLNGDVNTDLSDFPFLDEGLGKSVIIPYFPNTFSPVNLNINEDVVNNSCEVFPNPADQFVYFSFKNIESGASVGLFSPSGSLMCKLNLELQGENMLSVSEYPSGVYFLKINIDGKSFTKKLIIEH